MDFDRGATLATAPTLGLADTAAGGPTAGNGFYRRWPDDLALFQAHAITDIRLTLDWARLQPKPGTLDAGWAEQYEQMISAAEAIGLRVHATMFDGGVPRWFDNEGGIDDDEAVVKWWPRFVERVAERFGDVVDGWVPFAAIPDGLPDQPWRDTWGILGGGPPVVASVRHPSKAKAVAGAADRIGVHIDLEADDKTDPTDAHLADLAERWGGSIATAARSIDIPAAVTFAPRHPDPELGARLTAGLVTAIRYALADGVEVTTCFVDPGIAGPTDGSGLFDKNRAPLPALDALVAG